MSAFATAEFAVIGAGPTGCTFATLMARKGHDVVLIDRDSEPRAAVGESLLPFGNRVIEKVGISMDGFQRKDGAVFIRNGKAVRFAFSDAARTPWDHAHQVPRDEFDRRFRQKAREAGVSLHTAEVNGFDLPGVVHTDQGDVHAKWVVDAAGRTQLLARTLGIRRLHPELRNAALTAHYRGVQEFPPKHTGDITVCEFPGGWFWFIPFTEGKTSVGLVMAPNSNLRGNRWQAALDRCEDAQIRLTGAERLTPLRGLQDFTAYADRFHGDGWVLAGDAAMFLDPVFSSGVVLGLEAADRLVDALESNDLDGWESHLRASAMIIEKAILAWYSGAFLDLCFVPEELQISKYRTGITSLLAGDVFASGNPLPRRVANKFETLAHYIRKYSDSAGPPTS